MATALGVRVVVYVDGQPATYAKGKDEKQVRDGVQEALGVPAERLSYQAVETAPLADVQRVVAILHAEWLMLQLAMIGNVGSRIVRAQ